MNFFYCRQIRVHCKSRYKVLAWYGAWVFDAVVGIIKNSVCFHRLEKQRKKLQKEYLLKDLRDEKDERLEKVHE